MKRFTIGFRCDNRFEVIDENGRPVSVRPTRQSAQGYAYRLNEADAAGPKALANMLATTR